MPIRSDLLKILVCPACQADLEQQDNSLVCQGCKLVFPVDQDIPVLLIEEATPYATWAAAREKRGQAKAGKS